MDKIFRFEIQPHIPSPIPRCQKKTDEMFYNIGNPIVENFKNGNSYAIGGYPFDVLSLVAGPGSLKGISATEKLADVSKLAKVTEEINMATKLEKMAGAASKGGKFTRLADNVVNDIGKTLKSRIPTTVGKEFAIEGALGAAPKLDKSAFSKLEKEVAKGAGKIGKANGPNINALDDFVNNPQEILKNTTPSNLYDYLSQNGYNPQVLSKGSTKGIPFEDGGGFKITWGGDRILQYHPTGRHHGGVSYYKISSGTTGTMRFDLNGNPIK